MAICHNGLGWGSTVGLIALLGGCKGVQMHWWVNAVPCGRCVFGPGGNMGVEGFCVACREQQTLQRLGRSLKTCVIMHLNG